jgi:TonB family protein
MVRSLLAALLALAFASHALAQSAEPHATGPARTLDAVDAFFEVCLGNINWRERRLAAQKISGKASVLDSVNEDFPLDLSTGLGTLTVYWDSTCRVDAPAPALATVVSRFDAEVAKLGWTPLPSPSDREPLPGTSLQRNVVMALPGEFSWPVHVVLLSKPGASGATVTLIRVDEPPPPPLPPGVAPTARGVIPLVPEGQRMPKFTPGVEITPREIKAPKFPKALIASCSSGITRLLVSVSAKGKVLDVSVHRTSGYPEFDAAAVEAASQWRFNAGTANGKAVGGDLIVPVSFANPCY